MKSIFSPCYGAVTIERKYCPSDEILTVDLGGVGGEFNSIITGLTLELSGNYQFLHTLQDVVYFHAFGDRVGTLNVTGVGFVKNCGKEPKGSILKLYDYYQTNKATKQGGKAQIINISGSDGPGISLFGFLTGVRIDISDSQMGPVGYWALRFEVLPQQS